MGVKRELTPVFIGLFVICRVQLDSYETKKGFIK